MRGDKKRVGGGGRREKEREGEREIFKFKLSSPTNAAIPEVSLNTLTQIHLNATWYPGLDPGLAKHRLKKKKTTTIKIQKSLEFS